MLIYISHGKKQTFRVIPCDSVGYDGMKVSVIIPAYNAARTIASTVQSALDQTRPAEEIIIVDDGSTDDTVEIVRGLDGPIKLFQQENQGSAVARNRAIAESAGDLLAFLDADDLWVPEKLAVQVPPFEQDPELIFSFSNARNVECPQIDTDKHGYEEGVVEKRMGVTEDGGKGVKKERRREANKDNGPGTKDQGQQTTDNGLRTKDKGHGGNPKPGPPFIDFSRSHLRNVQHRREGEIVTFDENLQPHFLLGCPASTPGVVVKKTAVLKAGGFDPALRRGQDLDLWLRIAGLGTCNYVDNVLYHRRLHDSNVTHDTLRIDRVQLDILAPWLTRDVAWNPGQKKAFRHRLAKLNQSIGWRLLKSCNGTEARKYLKQSLKLKPGLKSFGLILAALKGGG